MAEPLLKPSSGSDAKRDSLEETAFESSQNEEKLELLPSKDPEKDCSSVFSNGECSDHSGEVGDSSGKVKSESKTSYLAESIYVDRSRATRQLRLGAHSTEGMRISSKAPDNNLDDLSNDFANTFMFDEELEVECGAEKMDANSSVRRYCMCSLLVAVSKALFIILLFVAQRFIDEFSEVTVMFG